MTTLEERAPAGFFLSPTEREALTDLLAKAERLSRELSDAYREAQRIVTATTDLDPTVDLGDPLALFRLQSGMVGYETTYADQVAVGDWVQRYFGDPDWHLVTDVEHLPCAPWGSRSRGHFVRVTYDGLAHDWGRTDALRIARRPEHVVADQERKTGAA